MYATAAIFSAQRSGHAPKSETLKRIYEKEKLLTFKKCLKEDYSGLPPKKHHMRPPSKRLF
jgi:hypothetical protein